MDINIKKSILDYRPTLKENTIKQYEINLNTLKKLFDTDDYEFLNNPKEVMNKIKHLHYTSQRNMLNGIIMLLNSINHTNKYDKIIKEYQDIRDSFNDKYSEEQKSGIISDKQSKNFGTMEEINGMIKKMEDEIRSFKRKRADEMNSKEKALIQVYTLFNIYSRMPFRNDVAGMEAIPKRTYNKLTNEQKEQNNYLVVEKTKLFFILNKYKTSKKYEELKIPIEDKELKKVLRYYIKLNGYGVLFKTATGNPLTRNALSQLLIKTTKKYLNKSISTTLLRKIYLSNKYSDTKKDMENDAHNMGHSVATAQSVYVKTPQPEDL
tara:strand:- start:1473 stop:2438 length:966 start_codon:yes stop_codon:yes gene_type:complete